FPHNTISILPFAKLRIPRMTRGTAIGRKLPKLALVGKNLISPRLFNNLNVLFKQLAIEGIGIIAAFGTSRCGGFDVSYRGIGFYPARMVASSKSADQAAF